MIELFKAYPLWSSMFVLSGIISLRVFLGLWFLPRHKNTSKLKRAIWSPIVLVPFLGPMFFGAFYRIPKTHAHSASYSVGDFVP